MPILFENTDVIFNKMVLRLTKKGLVLELQHQSNPGFEITRLQEYFNKHWNEIGRPQCLNDEIIYHFQRQQDEPLPMTFQVRSVHTDEIIKEFTPPYHCSNWRSCKGQGKVVFAGQADIADDPLHQNRDSEHGAHWQPVWVLTYDGVNWQFRLIPDTDSINEFYTIVYNPHDNHFYAGETDRIHGPADWSDYPNAGGVWRSPDGLNWTRIWEDPLGRLITVNVIGGEVFASCGGVTNRSIYRIAPSIQHILDYDLNAVPFHVPEYTWRGKIWASGLLSFDGTTISPPSMSNIEEYEKYYLYPIAIDNDDRLLIRIATKDWMNYTVGRLSDPNGSIEIIAENWMPTPHREIGTTGGCVSPNNKLYLGVFGRDRTGRTIYAALDMLPIGEETPSPPPPPPIPSPIIPSWLMIGFPIALVGVTLIYSPKK